MNDADEVARALDIARHMTMCGMPVFIAQPAMHAGRWDPRGGHCATGYWLPKQWQRAEADPTMVDTWQPWMALCAVGGQLWDFLDVDPGNGGSESFQQLYAAGQWPRVYGRQLTPSGGWHDLVAPLGVGSRDGFVPGIDLKGGRADGRSRGFVFLAPTAKLAKRANVVRRYTWHAEPMVII